nr:hypothetical protein [Acidimicrobiia bacterium]
NEFVAELRHVRGEAEATQEETSKLLASVVPRRLVDRILAGGRGITEALDNATLVAITLHGDFDDSEVDELAQQQSVLTAGAASIAREHGAEHLSSSASTVLYATGLESEGKRIEDGVEFADAVNRWAQSALADRGFLLAPSFGIAAGDVITGVMGGERLAVDVLGTPRQVSMDLSRVAQPGQILVGADTAASLGSGWAVERIEGLHTVAGAPLDAWSVRRRDGSS